MNIALDLQQILIITGASFAGGYLIFLGLAFFVLPRKLRSENRLQSRLILEEARSNGEAIKAEQMERAEEKSQAALEELEEELADRQSDIETLEDDLKNRQEYLQHEEARLEKSKREIHHVTQKRDRAKNEYEDMVNQLRQLNQDLTNKLEDKTGNSAAAVRQNMITDFVEKRQLEATKLLMLRSDELKNSASKMAARCLAGTQARYAPEFTWPKGVNHVELRDDRVTEQLADESNTLLKDLHEISEGVNITLVPSSGHHAPVVRLGGGYGIYKEATKLTLEEIVNKGPSHWGRAQGVYDRHRKALEAQALKLGKVALQELQLDGVHIEILRMVGSLNWRTSYRQNQFYHSLEVAKLAGILAHEMGVDPDEAKRCGLLHDIGKSIDYRIEGSHAVISGDYADRYGENKIICDTVMSHHADLIVETPLAYVLMSADTLSGARPGARVNLEEGYQDRLSSIQDVVHAFPGVVKCEIMNGAREVHVEVNHKKVKENDLESLSQAIARQIEGNVAFPGQIKVLVSRKFEAVAVA